MAAQETWLKFYIRRAFRIAPAYYLSLAVAVALAGPYLDGCSTLADRISWLRDSQYNGRHIEYSADNLALHATFIFGLLPNFSSSTQLPDWSLSLEMQFYAIFPFLLLAIRQFGALSVMAALVPICLAVTWLLHPSFREPSLLLFKLPVFCAGILLCQAITANSKRDRVGLRTLAILLFGANFPRAS